MPTEDAQHPATSAPGELGPNYAWVMNVGHLVGQDSFELAPGHILRRATTDERARIRDVIGKIPGGFFPSGRLVWETPWPNAAGDLRTTLPEDEWRYFVIAFEGPNRTLSRLQEACGLAVSEPEVAFTIIGGSAIVYYPARFFHVLQDLTPARTDFFLGMSLEHAAEITRLREKIERHDHELLDLTRFIGQLRHLKALPHQSPLRFLGYFGVLEALLTHQPRKTDTIDSITRQVKQKIALLDNRWQPRLDYSSFGNIPSVKVWAAMYSCRSKFAHGAEANFTAGELKILGSQDQALALLVNTVKAVMRHALDEPRLLADLKDC